MEGGVAPADAKVNVKHLFSVSVHDLKDLFAKYEYCIDIISCEQ